MNLSEAKLGQAVLVALLSLGPRYLHGQTLVEQQTFDNSLWTETHYCNQCNPAPDWSLVSTGYNPSCSPQQGSKMAMFNSHDAASGDAARQASDSLNLTGADVAEVRFWMFHSGGSGGDWLGIEVSTDEGSNYWGLVRFFRNDGTSGWREHVVPLGQYTDQTALRLALLGVSDYGYNIYIDDLRVYKQSLNNGVEGKACSTGSDCASGLCSPDPAGQGRCRDNLAGHDCISGDRVAVPVGTTNCFRGDVVSCTAPNTWNVENCYDDCGPYVDVHACEYATCVDCVNSCFTVTGEGCDDTAWCRPIFMFLGECEYKKENGQSCEQNKECLSNNCTLAPSGARFCEAPGTCAGADGGAVASGQKICYLNDLYTCTSGVWQGTDCHAVCGFYDDVDTCQNQACLPCATSCTSDEQCKPGILCQGNQCVGNLPDGQTCTFDEQCEHGHCVDGICCGDACAAPCYRCDITGHLGTCTPVPAGQDPDGDCAGEGVCAGSCNGQGSCVWPNNQMVCAVCARCDGAGHCNRFVAAGTDPQNECPTCQVCHGSAAACLPVAAGQDPLNDCQAQAAESCGTDGACDGAGACRRWPAETPCGGASCRDGRVEFPDKCDGRGLCVDGGSGSCGLFRCADSTRCAAACATHSLCIETAFCNSTGICAPDLGEGASCEGVVWPGLDASAACLGGFCRADNFDGSGAFCTSDPSACVHDGMIYQAGAVLCEGNLGFRVCQGGAVGWGSLVSCSSGLCDAGGGVGSGYREAGGCLSGPGGGCQSACISCEPFLAETGGHACRSSCTLDNQCWPGYQCRGGTCQLPEGIGSPCTIQADCLAGFCVDGVCCLEACAGPCRSCNQPGQVGRCRTYQAGSDPENECPAMPASSCGTTGSCDGQGACALHPAGTPCEEPRCQGDLLLGGGSCNGAGDCISSERRDCRPGLCKDNACRDTCASHADCHADGFCAADGTCSFDLADGVACDQAVWPGLERDPACRGGFCRDDSFNESGAYCTADETACLADGQGYAPGYRLCHGQEWFRVCLGGQAGWSPETACRPAGFCDAGGGPTSGVTEAESCTSGFIGGCRSSCQSCAPYLASQTGVCPDQCSEDGDCWPGFFCSNGVCRPRAEIGHACQADAECGDYFCRDGVCCNSDCSGPCRDCDDPRLPGACLFAIEGTDRRDDCAEDGQPCGATGVCDDRGACARQPAGTECQAASCSAGVFTPPYRCDGRGACQESLAYECRSGACQDNACRPAEAPHDGSDGGVDAGSDGGYTGPPIAEAGPPQVVRPRSRVTLDGSRSQGRRLTFHWELSSGPTPVSLEGATTARPAFFAEATGVYVFRLVVSDGVEESPPDFTQVEVVEGATGCGCATEAPAGGLLAMLLVIVAAARRWRHRLWLLLWAAWLPGCGDDVQGQLSLLVVPPHQGRNQSEDPFQLVETLELGLLGPDGSRRVLGSGAPLGHWAPGLQGGKLQGMPHLVGLNQRGRPVSQGFGPPIDLHAGEHLVVSVPLERSGLALAGCVQNLSAPFSAAAPSLRLDSVALEKGRVDGDDDASLLLWALWQEDRLQLLLHVRDDSVEPAPAEQPLTEGDAVKLYFATGTITLGANGRLEDGIGGTVAEVTTDVRGYQAKLALGLATGEKNQSLPFDVRLVDRDGAELAWLTWQFDPRDQTPDPPGERYGRLVLGVPLLEVLIDAEAPMGFPARDGPVRLAGHWSDQTLVLEAQVPDDEVRASGNVADDDRVIVRLDLANGESRSADPLRFFEFTVTAGSVLQVAAGNDWARLESPGAVFSGKAGGVIRAGGFDVRLELPWEDLMLTAGPPQRGWFMGLEVEVVDQDSQGSDRTALSGAPGAPPGCWPELRLYSLEGV